MGTLGDVGSLMSGAGALANVGVGVYNAYQQHQMMDYQMDLQREMFAREDTAIRRRVADLKAAGLSPVLAAGQGANAGPVVSTQAPRLDVDFQRGAQGVMEMLRGATEISKTEEEIKAIDQQRKTSAAEEAKKKVETAVQLHDYGIMRKTGLPSQPSTVGKIGRDFFGAVEAAKERIQKHLDSTDNVGYQLTDKIQDFKRRVKGYFGAAEKQDERR